MEELQKSLLASNPVKKFFSQKASHIFGDSGQKLPMAAESLALAALQNVKVQGFKMYKVYTIPKRSGGNRVIAHPSKELKAFQRGLVDILESELPIHSCAHAYVKRKSIKSNAMVHAKNQYLLKMDFLNFFNSVDVELLGKVCSENKKLEEVGLMQLANLIFWSPTKQRDGKLVLSVGAPTSPLLSNFVLYEFDNLISLVCNSMHVTYTRYADDLFFSTNESDILKNVPNIVKYFLDYIYGDKLRVNDAKTVFSSKAHNRHVTGLVITNSGRISLGRERKRFIKSMVYKSTKNELDVDELNSLMGILSFCQHVEPDFITRLVCKFGQDTVDYIVTAQWRG
ncbi:retron St85 family RNA-directed DNA polymerase [Shewanella sp. MSW]|uniref:retron St85 family RNA-directed DNA polymerase n=1 Tax=Shewanella TaxID=22 RepID=UPI001C92C70F|nr:retron St85 family RNA-directed DNA polymerase [Shewanella sp. MSW]